MRPTSAFTPEQAEAWAQHLVQHQAQIYAILGVVGIGVGARFAKNDHTVVETPYLVILTPEYADSAAAVATQISKILGEEVTVTVGGVWDTVVSRAGVEGQAVAL